MCLFSIAQECWTECDGVCFAGTPLDRDVSAPYSDHTPEEHRYALKCVSPPKQLLHLRTVQRERGFGHCMLEELLKFIQSLKCSTQRSAVPVQTVCYVVKEGWVATVNVTFPVVKPIHTCQNLVHNERKSSLEITPHFVFYTHGII